MKTLAGISVFFLGIFLVNALWKLDFNIFQFQNAEKHTLSGEKGSGNVPGTISYETVKSQKESRNITYILLTGRGGWNHDAPDLTDTIILAGINHTAEIITLFSIPRDLWVEYPASAKKWKINRIYEYFLPKGKKQAIDKLKEKVSEITGKPIDYYVNIDFKGFIEVVDALGWVEVTLEKNFVDYEYPDGNLWYRTFILRKWTWTLDGEVALMYARSRHSTSDFDRSLRQQEIISSLKSKVSNLGYFKDRKKIIKLYNIFSQYVETDMGLTDMLSLGLKIRSWEWNDMLSFNLNDSCFEWSPSCSAGGLLYVPLREYFWGASVLLPKGSLAKSPSYYRDIQKFARYIFDTPRVFKNPKNIVVYNASGTRYLAGKLADELRAYGFKIDRNSGVKSLKEKKFEKSVLQYNGLESNDETLRVLQDFFKADFTKIPSAEFSSEDTDIEIIIAQKKDY